MTSSSQEMTDTQALAAVLAAHASARAGDHPELDQLAGYLAGSLAPEAEASIQDHLVTCRACTAQLLDLESLSATGPRVAAGVADLYLALAAKSSCTVQRCVTVASICCCSASVRTPSSTSSRAQRVRTVGWSPMDL